MGKPLWGDEWPQPGPFTGPGPEVGPVGSATNFSNGLRQNTQTSGLRLPIQGGTPAWHGQNAPQGPVGLVPPPSVGLRPKKPKIGGTPF